MRRPKAFGFDVFGTVVDWRTSIARESAGFLARIGRGDLDAEHFADAWRARYQPAMAKVREGGRDFVILDTLHCEMLVDLLRHHGVDVDALDPALVTDWSHAWHRLAPWPDSVAGLARLRALAPVVTLSNGNVALMIELSRRAGLEWDAILGAEHARAFKPSREVYLSTAAACGVEPNDFCLVAAHHSDLAAARKAGLMTAYIDRPMEYGGASAPDRDQRQDWDYEADSLTALAAQLEVPK
ncbi:haloacid dehalogenase type II [Sphingomonas sp. HHU CXW]|uniref:Haloacid dehalogenase type II n=1 Tax=Sphingomonas hominis TaxID=2741495 RepID=A0ABX2JJW0_9SPHN|nr:haloacid dehalogenase type II [Sphingomonas hominis]NTS64742.1 haloacid dehalogenase type II [Sphingomonas hominis]